MMHGILGKSDKRYYLKVHVGKQKIWNDSGVVSVAYRILPSYLPTCTWVVRLPRGYVKLSGRNGIVSRSGIGFFFLFFFFFFREEKLGKK